MKQFSYKGHLLLAGLLLTIHNVEEAWGYAFFSLPASVLGEIHLPTVKNMQLIILFFTLLAWMVVAAVLFAKNEKLSRDLLAVLVTTFLINAFVPHIFSAVVLKDYTPALISSLALYLPYSFYILPHLLREYTSSLKFFKTVGLGVMLIFLLVVVLQLSVKCLFG